MLVWVGFWIGALLACWAMLVSRCVELAATARPSVSFIYEPCFFHLLFIGYSIFCVTLSLIWGFLLSHHFPPVTASSELVVQIGRAHV